MNDKEVIAIKNIEQKIYTIRGVQIMLDRDLAEFYQTETRTLKQAVKRNIDRFPGDFMFELTSITFHKNIDINILNLYQTFSNGRQPGHHLSL